MDIGEFRQKGYLQDVNRRFFHPLGLALEVEEDSEDGSAHLSGVWDGRDDLWGVVFDPLGPDSSEQEEEELRVSRERKAKFIDAEFEQRAKSRVAAFGWTTQPVGCVRPEVDTSPGVTTDTRIATDAIRWILDPIPGTYHLVLCGVCLATVYQIGEGPGAAAHIPNGEKAGTHLGFESTDEAQAKVMELLELRYV